MIIFALVVLSTGDETPNPTPLPTPYPTPAPTEGPTFRPTPYPTPYPTSFPTPEPTEGPTAFPTPKPTVGPTPYLCTCSHVVIDGVAEFAGVVFSITSPGDDLYPMAIDYDRMAENPFSEYKVFAAARPGGGYLGLYFRASSSGKTYYHIKSGSTKSFRYASQFMSILPDDITYLHYCPWMAGLSWKDTTDSTLQTLTLTGTLKDVSVKCVSSSGGPAVSAGDPHIQRLDGNGFDIDTTGSYTLFNVAGGSDFFVKSTVLPEAKGSLAKFNLKCEFGGSWLDGHNVTAVGSEGGENAGAGVYFDSTYLRFSTLLQDVSQYTWETEHAKMILENCREGRNSDYCTSVQSLRKSKDSGSHPYMTMVTDVANITVRWSSGTGRSHLDIYTTLRKDADGEDAGSADIGGLLVGPKHKIARRSSVLAAFSVGSVQ